MENVDVPVFSVKYEVLSEPRAPDELGSLFLRQRLHVHASQCQVVTSHPPECQDLNVNVPTGEKGAQ